MNREQRRAHNKKIRGDKRASICPLCGNKSLFYAQPVLKPYEGEKEEFVAEDFDLVINCEVCQGTVFKSDKLPEYIKPASYVTLPIDTFINAIKYAEEHPDDTDGNEAT